MKLLGVLPFARELLYRVVEDGDIVIDGTAGNGHDTLFLAKLVGSEGVVYSFDIQEAAIEATEKRLEEKEYLERVKLIHDGHENVLSHLRDEHAGKITGAIFNLGYLPGSDKTVVTTPATTIAAVHDILGQMKKEGILVLVVYHGHKEGKKERDELLPFVRELPQEEFHVLEYRFTNQKNNPPFIIAIEKRG
ncbi:putative methyltransferase [Evansella vedderi]|uniref:Methyltransferase n=1 Tax=Evansella vedderi TaxID=38282 RepID=A0ABT9ZUN4_9BACI|nr:class I SAM-dependent methyltransferase [Evansella vedderi]MDQ0254953.1 putative methyltransferase [Evansella vedderi]